MRALLRGLHRLEDGLLALLLLLLLGLAVGQILLRWVADAGWMEGEVAQRTLVLWIALLGALGAARERRHLAIDLLPRLLPPGGRRVVWALAQLIAAGLCAVMAWYGWQLVELEREAPGRLFAGLPSWAGMLIIPFGFALLSLRCALAAWLGPPAETPLPAVEEQGRA
ncbi:MAG: TRAP transporter small permease [Aquimonas sp.]|nr:TRAP transporter small permease [Aquimonas sp.]